MASQMTSASAPSSKVVLVTGGTGLIGRALQSVVASKKAEGILPQDERWIFLSSKDGNLVDRKECEAIFVRERPTHVIHLAARVGGLFANIKYKVEFYRENMLLNDNVMECCRIYEVVTLKTKEDLKGM